jgi:hypothetical protein
LLLFGSGDFMRFFWIAIVATLLISSCSDGNKASSVSATESEQNTPNLSKFTNGAACKYGNCSVGSIVVAKHRRDVYFYACRTKELAMYTNFILGLLDASTVYNSEMPNVNRNTGEPNVKGEAADTLKKLRLDAKVNTFDEAAKMCQVETKSFNAKIVNYPIDSQEMLVLVGKENLWVPKSHFEISQ